MKTIQRAAIVVLGIVLAGGPAAYAQAVHFDDPKLKAVVEAKLGKTNPTPTDMLALNYLEVPELGITDLTGLEYAHNLTALRLLENQVRDLSPLAGLTNMESLLIHRNPIGSFSALRALTKLVYLTLSGTNIGDISVLANLTNLTSVHLYQSRIFDLSPLAGLTKLKTLEAEDNEIGDLSPLANLTNLTYVRLGHNLINDISPLAGWTNIEWLFLFRNNIRDVSPLMNLKNLVSLALDDNEVSDIFPLVGLTQLQSLSLRGNPLHTEACTTHIPLMESHGTSVDHDACMALPDLLEGRSLISPGAMAPGQAFTYTYLLVNAGDAPAGQFRVEFYLSADRMIDRQDYLLGDQVIPGLGVGGTAERSFSGTIPLDVAPSVYTLGCLIDADEAVLESLEGNNTGHQFVRVLGEVAVPNVVGMSQSQAESAITSASLLVGTIWWDFSDTVPPGQVIRQDPPAGTMVGAGSEVDITLSLGPERSATIVVPNVVGMSPSQAQAAITAGGLVVGTITQSQSLTVPQGQVISQNPAAGTLAPPGAAVNLTVSTGTTPPEAPAAVPVAHWKLDETQGVVAVDSAGVHNGILRGNLGGLPAWLPLGGKIGGALSFDGIDDRVTCGTWNPSAATGKLGICLWAKWNGQTTSWPGLIAKRDYWGDGKTMWCLEMDNFTGKIAFFNEQGVRIGGGPVLPIGQWTHVAVSFDGTTATMYIDGDPTGSGPFAFPPDQEATLRFGSSEANGTNAFNGALDDIRLYDQPLSREEIWKVMGRSGPNQTPAVLVAHWRLDETQGMIAVDSAGGHDGTLNGNPKWQPTGGIIGGTLQLDGVDDYIDCGNPSALDIQDQITVACWIKVGAFDKAWQAIVAKGDSAWRIQRDGTRNALEFACTGVSVTGTGWCNILGNINVNDGQWHHVAGVYDGAALSLYIDGVVDTTVPATGQIRTNARSLFLGENSEARGRYFKGLVDDVQVYEGALSAQEVQQVMRGTPAGPGQGSSSGVPVAHWKLDETSGTTAADSSGNDRHGTLLGGPVWQPTGGMIGGALQFDGVNDYVDCGKPAVLDIQDQITLACWIKVASFTRNWQTILAKGDDSYALSRSSVGHSIYFGLGGTSPGGFDGAGVVADNEWHHIVGVYDGSNATLYIDGLADTAVPTSGKINVNSYPLFLGEDSQMRGRYWKGLLDDVRIYDYALSEADVAELAGATPPVGPTQVQVPNVVGKTQAAAQSAITAAGLVVGTVTQAASSTVAKGSVISQNPAAGASAASGSAVNLVVSSGSGDVGLVGWWKLDETSGASAKDSAGQSDGVLYGGPVWQPAGGKIAGALKFDGSNDYVQLPIGSTIASLTNSTFATWVNWTGASDWQRIFDFGGSQAINMFLTPRNGSTGSMRFAITTAGGPGEDQATAAQALPTGWHHVAVTIDAAGKTYVLYLDGQVKATKTAARYTPSSLGNTTQNWLGKSQYPDPYFAGSLDDFRIYNRVLSAAEVAQLATP